MKFYHVDSFTTELFRGNPAGVCILDEEWLPEDTMKNIAFENNMPETAFVTQKGGCYHIRWFTPAVEADLCGHATLAAGHALFNHEGYERNEIVFDSRRGTLKVEKIGSKLVLDFPLDTIRKIDFCDMLDCFDNKPIEAYRGTNDYMLVFESEEDIKNIKCDLAKTAAIDELDGIVVTARGTEVDFVSRNFAPKQGIDEDPVTGSSHTMLVAYWREVLGKDEFEAAQLSRRSGRLSLKIIGDRVRIGGNAVTYLVGELYV